MAGFVVEFWHQIVQSLFNQVQRPFKFPNFQISKFPNLEPHIIYYHNLIPNFKFTGLLLATESLFFLEIWRLKGLNKYYIQ